MKMYTITLKSLFCQCIHFIGAILTITLIMPTIAYTFDNPSPVPLSSAGTYGALAATGITGSASVNGDIGTTGGSIDGTIVPTGTNWGIGGAHNTTAQTDLGAALTNALGRSSNLTIPDALGGQTLTQGVYDGGALNLAGGTTLTLNAEGNANAVFIIKASSTLTINGGTVSLINGAVWSNVFWYVGTSVTIVSGSTFNGIVLAVTSITVNASATSVTAQLLANTGAVTINSTVLPVELTAFAAVINNNIVELNWQTATEVNNYGFEIQRSEVGDQKSEVGDQWEKIGFIEGAGNSNSPKEYSFVDNLSQTFEVYSSLATGNLEGFSYRLKQIDTDGKFTYSEEVWVSIPLGEVNIKFIPTKFSLEQNYPNPFNPSTTIKFGLPAAGKVLVEVYNTLGERVADLVNEIKDAGFYEVQWNAGNLSSGIYFYTIRVAAEENSKNFNVVKKMVLVK